LPICSSEHHHVLKRRLTPARDDVARNCRGAIAAAVMFIGREDVSTRAVAQVLFAA